MGKSEEKEGKELEKGEEYQVYGEDYQYQVSSGEEYQV